MCLMDVRCSKLRSVAVEVMSWLGTNWVWNVHFGKKNPGNIWGILKQSNPIACIVGFALEGGEGGGRVSDGGPVNG